MLDRLLEKFRAMGFLRNGLHVIALLFTVLLPFARGPEYSDTWNLFFAGILPATSPLLVIVIGLDIMMSSIWRSDARELGDTGRVELMTSIIKTHWIIGGLLLGAWLAVFLPVLL